MTIIDRYLSFLFLKTVLTCMASVAGLFVVVHLFSNLDELTAISQEIGWWGVFQEFYLPQFADLFDKSVGIVVLIAAIFSISLLQRRRELTALEANGLTKGRILRSVFVLAGVMVLLAVLNREFIIPQVKEKLVQTPQSWGPAGKVKLKVQSDLNSGVVLRGDSLLINEKKIINIDVQLPQFDSAQPSQVKANYALVCEANEQHPRGLLLCEVQEAGKLVKRQRESKLGPEQVGIWSRATHPWLEPRQCFVPCAFDVQEMAYGSKLVNYVSTKEMIHQLHQPVASMRSRRKNEVAVHARIVKPILEMTLLLLGLPVVVGGADRNAFVSAGICFWIIVAVQLTTIVCYALGTSSLIRPSALAAWLPVLIFVPLAAVAYRRLKR